MKIRMRPGYVLAGPDVFSGPDGVVEAPEAQALAIVRAGCADAIDPLPAPPELPKRQPEVQTATPRAPRERATRR